MFIVGDGLLCRCRLSTLNVLYTLDYTHLTPRYHKRDALKVLILGVSKVEVCGSWIVGLLLPRNRQSVSITPIVTNHSISWASCMYTLPHTYLANKQVIKTQSHLARD
jgi:hypothetical protein